MTKVLSLDEIKLVVENSQLIAEIEAGYVLYSEGRVNVPPVGFLHFDQPPGDVHIKYGAIADDDVYVLKLASAFYENPNLGAPVGDGLMLVLSQKTGELKTVLLDKGWLTDMRTAAAGAVAAKHLAPGKIANIGIVGTGVQSRLQLEFLRGVVDCQSCLVWGRSPPNVDRMIEDMTAQTSIQEWELDITAADSLEDLVRRCNLIVTTTPSREPLIRADWVQHGTHITAVGSDDYGKQELESLLLAKADLVVADSISQCVDHGECRLAVQEGHIDANSIHELGNIIANPKIGRSNDAQITVADLTGVAIQDIQIAKMVDRAQRI